MLILLLVTAALAQDPTSQPECPESYTCLTDEQYAQVHGKLEELAVIEDGEPTVEFTDSLIILTDEDGRVFTNATGDDTANHIKGKVTWGHVSADVAMKVDVDVQRKESPLYGFRLRPKLLTSYLILRTDFDGPMRAVDFGLDLDFLYWRKWNLSAYVGARSVGVDVGFDVFQHSGIGVGAHWAWPSGTEIFPFTPAAGWYFAF